VEGYDKKFVRQTYAPLFVPAPLPMVFIDRRLNSVELLFCSV